MEYIKAVIIDDEWKARENLKGLLERNCSDVEVVAMCSNSDEARAAILFHTPDLLFLDVKMPQEDGFEFLRSIREKNFKIIFVTAHSNFAVEAFEEDAVDYLLKPIHSRRLIKAIEKFNSYNSTQVIEDKRQNLPERIAIPTIEGFELFEKQQLIRLEAQRSSTIAHLLNGKSFVVPRNLKKVECMLDNTSFVRVHRSHLINTMHIQKVIKEDGGFVLLKDGTRIEISRRKRMDLLKLLGITN